MKHSLLTALILIAVTGCYPAENHRTTLGNYNFNYRIQDRESVGLVQVFDDSSRTYLQFVPGNEITPIVRTDGLAQPLETTKDGSYYLVNNIFKKLLVALGNQSTWVEKINPQPKAALPEKQPAADMYQAQLESCKHDNERLNDELAQCEEKANKTNKGIHIEKTVIYFQANQATPEGNIDAESIAVKAQYANRILIAAYTAAARPTKKSVRLAAARATYVKRVLVGQGIPALKIKTAYYPSGHNIANNSTSTGRAENRRAEINYLK